MHKQLNLFPAEPLEELRRENEVLRKAMLKMQGALFARHSELAGLFIELSQDVQDVKDENKKMRAQIAEFLRPHE